MINCLFRFPPAGLIEDSSQGLMADDYVIWHICKFLKKTSEIDGNHVSGQVQPFKYFLGPHGFYFHEVNTVYELDLTRGRTYAIGLCTK